MTTDKVAVMSLAQGLVDTGYDRKKKQYDVAAIRRSLLETFDQNLDSLEITADGPNVRAQMHHNLVGYIVIDGTPRNHHSQVLA